MIRSRHIPQVLDRICDEKAILSAVLVTMDGELLGTSTNTSALLPDPESFGTLVADIAVEYIRLGDESNTSTNRTKTTATQLQCLLLELDLGIVAASQCGPDFLVLAVAAPDAPPGAIKARIEAVSVFVQEALSTLTEG